MTRHISPQKARDLAYSWHSGQSSGLYAFASSGLVADQLALLSEISKCAFIARSVTDKREVHSLYRFARDCLARVPGQYPFAAPWAREVSK